MGTYPTFKGGLSMSIRIKTLFLGVSVAIAFGFAANNSAAQSIGPAALAAKQQIKAQVLTAMADGKISQNERRDILLNAKDICTAKEYVGLVETMNRLSPADRATPENLGYAPYTDKKLMAKFPTPDLSWIEKSPVGNIIPKQSVVKETMPKQTVVVREIITKQTIVRETAPNQTIAKTTVAKQSVAKNTTPKQSVAKKNASKQTVAKTTKPNASSKVVTLTSSPQQNSNKQSNAATAGKAQNRITNSDISAPPLPPAEHSQTRKTFSDKPSQLKVAESQKKHAAIGEDISIQQPAQLLKKAEKTSTKHSYTDYSVPVLTTPAAAFLIEDKSHAVKASYDDPLEPDENSQSLIR